MTDPIAVGVAGLGRSGWNNHVHAFRALPELYRLVAVADPDADRREQAQRVAECRGYAHFEDLLGDPAVELVVVATPTHLHVAHAVAALEAGHDVVCEKPMAADLAEADAMAAAAGRTGRLLTVFKNRRFEPEFLKVCEVVESGVLGRLLTVKLRAHRFARRADWQTVSGLGGGALRNTGSHLIDLGLILAGDGAVQPRVVAGLARALGPGDAEDHLKVVLQLPAAPIVDVEVSEACAAPEPAWTLMGTRGTLTGSHDALTWRFVREDELAPLAVDHGPAPGREYRAERIAPHERSWRRRADAPRSAIPFYRNLQATLRAGAPLAVTPDSARRVMWIVDECFRQASAA